jgi:hypothetical protein
MKRIIVFLPALFFLFISCDNKKAGPEKDTNIFVGKWRLSDYDTSTAKEADEERREERSQTIEFSADGNYTAITKDFDGEVNRQKGTYKYDLKAGILETIADGDDDTDVLRVEIKSRNKIFVTFRENKLLLERD